MPTETVAIFGAGGHAKVALDALRLARPGVRVEIWDDDPALAGRIFCGLTVQAPSREATPQIEVHVAIGTNRSRQKVAERLVFEGRTLLSIIHPTAVVAAGAELGHGLLLCAGAIVGPQARIGDGTIVNHGAIVDHDCVVGEWAHIAPGAVLGGAVQVGAGCLVGAGAVVLPGISIAPGAQIGAGAVVTRAVAPNATVAGVPARMLSRS